MNMSKKTVSILLPIMMLILIFPSGAFAEEVCTHSKGFYNIKAVEPTCTTPGNIAYKECKWFCGYYTDTKGNPIAFEETVIPATGEHTFGDDGKCIYCGGGCSHEGGKATCTEKAVCTKCSESYGELDAKNHASVETYIENAIASTCTVNGYSGDVYYSCCDMLKEKGSELPLTEHNYSEAFTELDSMTHGRKCTDCSALIATEEHKWIITNDSYDSTCCENGYKKYECTLCPAVKQEVVPSKGHSEAQRRENEVLPTCSLNGSYDVVTYCTVCNEILKRETETLPETNEHVYDIEVENSRIEPTCTENGSVSMMCVCGKTEIVSIDSKGHSLSFIEEVKATCTSEGNIEYYICLACNKKFSDKDGKIEISDVVTEKLSHIFDNYIYDGNATCLADGTETAVCSSCHTESDTRIKVGTKLEHSFTRYISDNNATCINDGTVTAICDNCKTASDTKIEVGSKDYAPHQPDEKGRKCLLCSKTLSEEHNWSDARVVIKEVGCFEDGAEAIVCLDCGEIKPGTKVAIVTTGHNYTEDWKEILAPTCDQAGVRIRICKRCYDVLSETLSKTEHKDKNSDGKCDECGYVKPSTDSGEKPTTPITPDNSDNSDSSSKCTCSCHSSGFSKIMFDFLNFFYKLFGINRVCECGASH